MSSNELTFTGLSISSGKVYADVCLYSAEHGKQPLHSLQTPEQVEQEIVKVQDALTTCSHDLELVAEKVKKNVGEAEAAIFNVQRLIMNDDNIVNAIYQRIRKHKKNAETAVTEVFEEYEDKFSKLENQYFQQRSNDIDEVKRRLLRTLRNIRPGFRCEGQRQCSRGKNRIIVARELTADMMANMDFENIRGLVTEHGGRSSHAAIIARSVGIPAVSGIAHIYDNVSCGTSLLVDGDNGTVYVEPSQDTVEDILTEEADEEEETIQAKSPPGTAVLANCSMMADVKQASSMHADGIGLFRTEILLMQAGRLLNEDEQFDYYAQVYRHLGDKPVTFRLLDVGGDKALPFLRIKKEANPYLGWRGARFLLGNNDIFTTQVKALLRLSTLGKVRILFPMVVDASQVDELIRGVRELMVSEPGISSDNISLGVMFEVPSACIQADAILQRVDFGSIGSNDLIQYLFAVDRDNDLVSQDYNPHHPILWDMLERLSASAHNQGKPLSICGEMAGRKGIPQRLYETGITSLSVSPKLIQRVRHELTHHLSSHTHTHV